MPIKKINLPNGTVVDIEDSKIFRGTCSTAAATYTKTVVCPEFTANDLVAGVLVLVKFDYTNTRTGSSVKLNVNGTGAYTVYSFSSGSRSALASAATINAAFPNLFVFCGDSWQILYYNTNTTYSAMTQEEIDAGTQTGARTISPKLLRDNFFTDDDVDSAPTANSTNLVTSGGVKTAVDAKQDIISDLATIRSGAALGATALQSYTETDPTVPSWAKASTKPSYTAVEVGAQPTLVSGTNIKTINNQSLLGSGNISIIPTQNVEIKELDWEMEWEEGETTQLQPGTYDGIVNLLNQGKIVVLNARQNGGPVQQLYLSYGPEFYDDFFTFSTIPDESRAYTYITINSDDTCTISLQGLESHANKVTSLSSSSTDTEYPSALCVYNLIGDIETLINAL